MFNPNRVLPILLFCLFGLLAYSETHAQKLVDTTTWQAKGTVFNTNFVSMPNLTGELEYRFGRRKSFGLELGVGFIGYSFDENDPALGYKINQKFNFTYHRGKKLSQGVGIQGNYAKFNVKTYLLTEESATNGTYFKYEKLDLIKQRYGGNIEYQLRSHTPVFWELNVGFGIMHYSAEPKSITVIQDAYRNGIFYLNHMAMFNPILRFKIGYKL